MRGGAKEVCVLADCDRWRAAYGYCELHWRRLRTTGVTHLRSYMEKFNDRYEVDPTTGCWVWQRGKSARGYGEFRADGRNHRAYRWRWEQDNGPVPVGLQLDHLCRNRACVNPAHLEPVTPRENLLRSPITLASINARKTHCIHGHEFTPENTAVFKGERSCRTCARERARVYRQRAAA